MQLAGPGSRIDPGPAFRQIIPQKENAMTADTRQQERERRREALTQVRKRLRAEIRDLNTLMRDHADHIADVIGTHGEGRCAANRDRAEAGTL